MSVSACVYESVRVRVCVIVHVCVSVSVCVHVSVSVWGGVVELVGFPVSQSA